MTVRRGKLIVIEGIDGAGTTTQAKFLAHELDAILAREPTGVLEPTIRMCLDPANDLKPDAMAMAVLFTASQVLNKETIERDLANGHNVVSDRHAMSTMVYQGDELPHLDRHFIRKLTLLSHQPDMTLVLDVDPEIAARRIAQRKKLDIYEGDREFQARLRASYLIEALNTHNCYVIDANQSEVSVHNTIKKQLWRVGLQP